jgi:hypothetical protein
MPASAADHLNEPEQKQRTAAMQRQRWTEHRAERRQEIALGHVRGVLTDYPESLPRFLAVLAEVTR